MFAAKMANTPIADFKPCVRISDKKNPFVLEVDSYTRDIHPVKHAVDQAAWHLHIQTGIAYSHARAWVVEKFKNREFSWSNPHIHFLKREEGGDRFPTSMPITQYLNEVIENEEILAPTMTSYIPTSKYESILAGYIMLNLAKRNKAKKAMFAAKMANDTLEEFFKDLEQRNTKLSNNSISGAHASNSTPLYNQTNHSTLTSNCRMTSGQGNANNEKLLSGNRHYWAPYIVINNIISITQNTEYDKFEAVMQAYNLHYPSVQDTMDCITYSTDLYWRGNLDILRIRQLVMSLTPLQRAAFVYTGDLYHLAKHNRDMMYTFISKLSAKKYKEHDLPHEGLEKLPEDYVNLAHQLCEDEWAGEGKKYKEMFEKGKQKKLNSLLATSTNTYQTVQEYADFIRVIFVSDNVPASVPYFPQSIRRSALTSDTDSTIFTTMWWVCWYHGKLVFGEKGNAIAATMIFLAAQAIRHILARFSINMGVDKKHIWRIAMKNEFFFPVFSPTEVSKHYFALRGTQEGNVFSEPEAENKGVHLKNSNAPKDVNDMAAALMMKICKTVMAGETLSIKEILKYISNVEKEIIGHFKKGDTRFSRRGLIQSVDSYKTGPIKSNYIHHLFWKEVFAPKYGFNEEPPYAVVKLSGAHNSPTDTAEWLDKLDVTYPDTAARVRAFLKKYDKDKLTSFMVPKNVCDTQGVPEELMEAINVRKLTSDITRVFYLILRNLGYYGLDKKMAIMISDSY